ncbi:MAG: DUF2270 domain-containing protein, partial [Candidatus Acetothermia bacterium]
MSRNTDQKDEEKPEISSDKIEAVLIHLYRGEIQRVNTWQGRLDKTPYWTLVMVAGMISWSFSAPNRSPALILVTIPLASALLTLEANRYQIHEVWRSRVRLLEENLFNNILDPEATLPRTEWMKVLSEDLREPQFKVSFFTALAMRLRRIYLWIFATILVGWFMKLTLHPIQAASIQEVIERARIGFIPGLGVTLFMLSFFIMISLLGILEFSRPKKKEEARSWRRNRATNGAAKRTRSRRNRVSPSRSAAKKLAIRICLLNQLIG